jgi:hypothetical protein
MIIYAVFWPELGTNNLLAALVGIAVIWLLTAVNVLGVRQRVRPGRGQVTDRVTLCAANPAQRFTPARDNNQRGGMR